MGDYYQKHLKTLSKYVYLPKLKINILRMCIGYLVWF